MTDLPVWLTPAEAEAVAYPTPANRDALDSARRKIQRALARRDTRYLGDTYEGVAS